MASLLGQRFGRLTVTSEKSGKVWGRMCLCVCDCGNERWVRAVELRRKKSPTKSCCGRHPCEICGKSIGRQGEWSHMRLHREGR
jgi:hypothetical protein